MLPRWYAQLGSVYYKRECGMQENVDKRTEVIEEEEVVMFASTRGSGLMTESNSPRAM